MSGGAGGSSYGKRNGSSSSTAGLGALDLSWLVNTSFPGEAAGSSGSASSSSTSTKEDGAPGSSYGKAIVVADEDAKGRENKAIVVVSDGEEEYRSSERKKRHREHHRHGSGEEKDRKKDRKKEKKHKKRKKEKKRRRREESHRSPSSSPSPPRQLTDKEKILMIERNIATTGTLPVPSSALVSANNSYRIPAPAPILLPIVTQGRTGGRLGGDDDDSADEDLRLMVCSSSSGNEKAQYSVDKQGDTNNALYFYSNPATVPRYYRQRYCKGMASNEVLIPRKDGYVFGGAIAEEAAGSMAGLSRYYNARVKGQLVVRSKPIRVVRSEVDHKTSEQQRRTDSSNENEDFIALGGNDDAELRKKDEEDQKSERERRIDEAMQKARDFNIRLRDNPKDVELWIAYADFQEEFVTMGSKAATAEGGKRKEMERATAMQGVILEKKIAVYEKALEINPNDERLILAHLATCELVWE